MCKHFTSSHSLEARDRREEIVMESYTLVSRYFASMSSVSLASMSNCPIVRQISQILAIENDLTFDNSSLNLKTSFSFI